MTNKIIILVSGANHGSVGTGDAGDAATSQVLP